MRATVQLAAVGALIALVFEVGILAIAFVAAMVVTAALTSGGRIKGVPHSRARAIVAIGLPAVGAAGILIAVGAFEPTPRAAIPTAGILIGGAMTATTLTGRRLLEGLDADAELIEARLASATGSATRSRRRSARRSRPASSRPSTRRATSGS